MIASRLTNPDGPAESGRLHRNTGEMRRKPRGFTLIELAIVLMLMIIILAGSFLAIQGYLTRTMIARAVTEIRMVEKEIILFQASCGEYPSSLEEIDRQNLLDPWGVPYVYTRILGGLAAAAMNDGDVPCRFGPDNNPLNTDFDLFSCGKDAASSRSIAARSSRDDVIRARNGLFIGLAANFR
ncbi:MAG: prepilin-type N-terminal cleavage/methylation domain-containing protein [bacterium]|nr:prepilin-type N-terminal cleavage/methylation domain-containing protein [bacterium]